MTDLATCYNYVSVLQVKWRQVGNSVGLTIPSSELQSLNAKAGDIVELEISRVVRHVRDGWEDDSLWEGADDEPILLDGSSESSFDGDEWEWR